MAFVLNAAAASGGGKSTVLGLIQRFHAPESGRIAIDGQDISEVDLVSLRDRIAFVSQDVFLFRGAIRDNIALGRPGATQDEIEEAARKANAHDFILDLPGATSPLLATAIGMSDHVLIPIQGCAMDAQGGAQVLELLKYLETRANIRIPHSVVLSRVNSMVTTRALQVVKELLWSRNVRVLDTPIIERSAYRDLFDYGCSLHEMTAERFSNLDKAKENAAAFANEVLGYVPNRSAVTAPTSQVIGRLRSVA